MEEIESRITLPSTFIERRTPRPLGIPVHWLVTLHYALRTLGQYSFVCIAIRAPEEKAVLMRWRPAIFGRTTSFHNTWSVKNKLANSEELRTNNNPNFSNPSTLLSTRISIALLHPSRCSGGMYLRIEVLSDCPMGANWSIELTQSSMQCASKLCPSGRLKDCLQTSSLYWLKSHRCPFCERHRPPRQDPSSYWCRRRWWVI